MGPVGQRKAAAFLAPASYTPCCRPLLAPLVLCWRGRCVRSRCPPLWAGWVHYCLAGRRRLKIREEPLGSFLRYAKHPLRGQSTFRRKQCVKSCPSSCAGARGPGFGPCHARLIPSSSIGLPARRRCSNKPAAGSQDHFSGSFASSPIIVTAFSSPSNSRRSARRSRTSCLSQ